MRKLENLNDEDLVSMICGIYCHLDPMISIENVKEEILLRLKRGDQ